MSIILPSEKKKKKGKHIIYSLTIQIIINFKKYIPYIFIKSSFWFVEKLIFSMYSMNLQLVIFLLHFKE